jgi:hypothetical protein
LIPEVTGKPLPLYFPSGMNDLKAQMTRRDLNPLTTAYVVDVHVQYVDGEPQRYFVTALHDAQPESTDEI